MTKEETMTDVIIVKHSADYSFSWSFSSVDISRRNVLHINSSLVTSSRRTLLIFITELVKWK